MTEIIYCKSLEDRFVFSYTWQQNIPSMKFVLDFHAGMKTQLTPFLSPARLAGGRLQFAPCVCVRAWVTQFSLKLLQLHIFGKLVVLMNFYALQYSFFF